MYQNFRKTIVAFVALGLAAMFSAPTYAQAVFITQEIPFLEFDNGVEFHVIERDQNNDATISEAFAKNFTPLPSFLHPADGSGTGC